MKQINIFTMIMNILQEHIRQTFEQIHIYKIFYKENPHFTKKMNIFQRK